MEPEVLIIELTGTGVFKVYFTGVSFTQCTQEEVIPHLNKKIHLFILVNNKITTREINSICGYFYRNSSLESISVMYTAVGASLALGTQNIVVIGIEDTPDKNILCTIDLVSNSSLLIPHSNTVIGDYNTVLESIISSLSTYIYKNNITKIHIKNHKLKDTLITSLTQRGMVVTEVESTTEEIEYHSGYSLVEFPLYFEQNMPHNLLPDSDIAYVGAVLTVMINYFEIKEVNTKEDYDAGLTKNLILN
ncbi:hypothetical protein NEOKW01_1136 [Nematocida sp. AWRm80]|nr:hypothetical protein NEOKW01_1136 [Nematocida sp. AWRm80]